MCTTNKASLAALLGMLSMLASGPSVADSAPDISGKYNCKYHDPLSNPTDSTEDIIFKKMGDNYKVSQLSTGSVIPYGGGWGLFNKDINNGIAYIYWLPKTPTYTNIVFFTVKPDGSLDGVFSQSNKDRAGTETCTKAPN